MKVCLYRWVLSSDLDLVRLLHVLICPGREFDVFGAAYLNDLAANVLCLMFGNSSIGPMLFDYMLSHAGLLMVMSPEGILGCLVDAFKCEYPYLVGDSQLYGQPVQALEYFG